MHDVAVGIQERSSPSQLRTLSETAGLRVQKLHHWPMTLSFAIFMVRLWQRLKLRWGTNESVTSDVSLPPAWLNRILSGVCRADEVLFKKPLWGSSCFLISQNK